MLPLIANRKFSRGEEDWMRSTLRALDFPSFRFFTTPATVPADCPLVIIQGADAFKDITGSYRPIETVRGYFNLEWRVPLLPTFNFKDQKTYTGGFSILCSDLKKAKAWLEKPQLDEKFTIIVDPPLAELHKIVNLMINEGKILSFDLETEKSGIDVVGFCNSEDVAYSVSVDEYSFDKWKEIKRLLESPIPKLAQNGVSFDIEQLKQYGIIVQNYAHDTLNFHHALYSELPKNLGFMTSLHCNFRNWKDAYKAGKATGEEK